MSIRQQTNRLDIVHVKVASLTPPTNQVYLTKSPSRSRYVSLIRGNFVNSYSQMHIHSIKPPEARSVSCLTSSMGSWTARSQSEMAMQFFLAAFCANIGIWASSLPIRLTLSTMRLSFSPTLALSNTFWHPYWKLIAGELKASVQSLLLTQAQCIRDTAFTPQEEYWNFPAFLKSPVSLIWETSS